MPEYEFRHEPTGDITTKFFSLAEMPRVGEKIKRYGRNWTRIYSIPQKPKVWSRTFVAKTIQLNHPDAPNTNAKGEACFSSDREVSEFCAKTGMSYD